MKAMLTLSLGETNPVPPSTLRGTIEKPSAAMVVCVKNFRRDIEPSDKV
jgi:hypothetical protein